MRRELDIQIKVNPVGALSATDMTSYVYLKKGLCNYISLEYLYDKDDNLVNHKILPIVVDESTRVPTTFKLNSDGKYTYYKLIIPTLEMFHCISTIDSGDTFEIDDSWAVSGKIFYYNGNFYYSEKDLQTAAEINSCEQITNFNILWNQKDSQGFFFFEKCIFSIWNLEKCLLSLQRKIIENCHTNKCVTDIDIKYRRDFILDSVFVLKYMMSLRQYEEAQRILDNLSSCDGFGLCEDESRNISSGCGCGRSV